jgi:hypothetical protein
VKAKLREQKKALHPNSKSVGDYDDTDSDNESAIVSDAAKSQVVDDDDISSEDSVGECGQIEVNVNAINSVYHLLIQMNLRMKKIPKVPKMTLRESTTVTSSGIPSMLHPAPAYIYIFRFCILLGETKDLKVKEDGGGGENSEVLREHVQEIKDQMCSFELTLTLTLTK